MVQLVVLASEELCQQYAGHGERLLGDRGDLGHGTLGAGHHLPPPAPDPAGEQEEDRQDRHRHQREFPRQEQHGDHDGDQRGNAGNEVGEGVGHHRLDSVYVVGDPRLHFAGAGAGQETQRHPKQVVVDALLQIARHILPHLAGQVGLDDAQHPARHGDGRHQPGEQPEEHQVQRAVGGEKGRVEDLPDEDGVDDAQAGADDYQHTHNGNRQLVGAEQPDDSSHQAVLAAFVQLTVMVRLHEIRRRLSCRP